tara:strand:- start:39 stop:1025 length:987 start_codon:yes stop_codon:yes gene_type:complete
MIQNVKGKKYLINGGLGMIGSTIAKILVEAEAEVSIVDAMIKPFGANLFNIKKIKDQVKTSIFDIKNTNDLKKEIEDKDVIFNLAGQVAHNDSIINPLYDANMNYLYQLNVMECIRQVNPNAKIIFSGSRLQFGKIENVPVDENHVSHPETPYAFHKQTTENMYQFYNRQHDIDTVVFRIANPYGPRGQIKHSKYTIINFFIRQALEGKTISIFGEGNQLRDYIFVEDLANAFIAASISTKSKGQIFNIGSGKGTSFIKMVKTIIQFVGKGSFQNVPWPKNYINVETGDYITNITKAKSILKWKPEIDFEEGIRMTVEYYIKHISEYL